MQDQPTGAEIETVGHQDQLTDRRVRVTVLYDENAEDPRQTDDHSGTHLVYTYFGMRREVYHEDKWSGTPRTKHYTMFGSIHEAMRGESVAIKVDVPQSMSDRDAGPAIIYMGKEDVIAEYGKDTLATRAQALERITAEASEWAAWRDGCAFGYTVEEIATCTCCGQEVITDDKDSCWGFITADPKKDLEAWMGDGMTADAKAALRLALTDGGTGNYPKAGVGIVPAEVRQVAS